LGSLSRISPYIARRAVEDYLSIDIILLKINEEVVRLASIINEEVNIKYDAVHAALMLLNDIPTIIINDTDDWEKIRKEFAKVIERIKEEGYTTSINKIDIVTPDNYKKMENSIGRG